MIEILIALLIALLAFEIKSWFPKVLSATISLASQRLPKTKRARYKEEWSAHLNEVPGAVAKIWQAVGFLLASGRMFPRWQRALAHRRATKRANLATRTTVRFLDVFFSLLLAVLLIPLFASVSLVLRRSGPALVFEKTVTSDGKELSLLRFRNPTNDNPESKFWSAFGNFLQKSQVAEVPKLWNVIRSDMSLIGSKSLNAGRATLKPSFFEVVDCAGKLDPARARSVSGRIVLTVLFYIRSLLRAAVAFLSVPKKGDEKGDETE